MSAEKFLSSFKSEVLRKGFNPRAYHWGVSDGQSDPSALLKSTESIYGSMFLEAGKEKEKIIDDWAYQLHDKDFRKTGVLQDKGYWKELAAKDYAKWDKLGVYPVEGPLWEEVLQNYLKNRFEMFSRKFKAKANFNGVGIEIYRCLTVENPEKLLEALKKNETYKVGKTEYSGAGIFWSWDHEAAKCYWGGSGEAITITALASLSDIDYTLTAELNLNSFYDDEDENYIGEEEKEIRLKAGSPITITKVDSEENGVIFESKMRTKACLVTALKKVL